MAVVKDVRLYRPGDETGITGLFSEVFGRTMPVQEWRWKYIESHPEKVYSTVAEDDSGKIVGHYGGVCLPLIFHGKEIYGHAICDVMVHPRYRGIRTFRRLLNLFPIESAKDGIKFGYGFPNSTTLLKPAILSGLYEKVEDVIEGTKNVEFYNDFDRYAFKLFPLDYSDSRIDSLWESCKYNYRITLVKDSKYLVWRYGRNPLYRYELWGLKNRFGSRLYAYAVLKREKDRVLVIDLLFDMVMVKVLFKKIENYVYAIKREAITLWAPPFMRKVLGNLGFDIRPAGTAIPRSTYYKYYEKKEIKGQFFYSMGDTDLF